MFRLICSGVLLLLMLFGCGASDPPTRRNDFTPLTSIRIVADAPAIAMHTSGRLSVIGNFSGQFTRDITEQAVWTSSAPAVADFITAGSPNRVTGRAPGSAALTATVGGVSATFDLTVTPATISFVTITPAAPAITKGLTAQLAASGTFSDGTTQDLTFDATWASDTPGVATVSDAADSKGLAKALAVGTTTITATFDGVIGTTPLTVLEVVLQSITVVPANPTLLTLTSRSFQAIGNLSDGSTADITSQATWSSSRPDIATVAATGRAVCNAPGTTTISAGLNGVNGNSTLKVIGGSLTGIAVSPAALKLVKGTVGSMSATGSFSNGSSRDITGVASWTVLSPLVADVTTPGGNQAVVTPLAVTATPVRITAGFGTVTGESNLAVTAPQLQSIAISPASLELTLGSSGRFTLNATFSDGTTQDVTASADWLSDATGTAPVDNTGPAKGRVHGVAATAVPVTITAAFGGTTKTATVTVRSRTIATLAISGSSPVTVASGNQVRFTATATYTDGTSKDVTEDVTWTTDDSNVATLADSNNQPGQILGVDIGSTTLRATLGGTTQTVILTVK